MQPTRRDYLLTAKPVAGTLVERSFTPTSRNNVWVTFEPEDAEPWVGVFGSPGVAHYADVVSFPHDAQLALVIAGGQGYIVHRQTGTLVRRTPWDYCYAALPVPGTDIVLIADPARIWAASPEADRYATSPSSLHDRAAPATEPEAIGLDGIVFDRIQDHALHGWYEAPSGWYAFTLDLLTLSVERGSRVAGIAPGLSAATGMGYPPNSEADERWRALNLWA